MIKLKTTILFLLTVLGFSFVQAQEKPITKESFDNINLTYPDLKKVNNLYNAGKYEDAASALLSYYRKRISIKNADYNIEDKQKYAGKKLAPDIIKVADNALLHKFKPHKSYPFFDYGKDINWQYQPVQDALIRTFLHRTTWWINIGQAYWSTSDEKYAKEWIFELRDWVKKNPQGAYKDDKNFAWKPLVVSFRLNYWSSCFNMFINSPNFTPSFLMEFLNSYNEQADYVMANYTPIGNHRLFESLHIMYASGNFPELKNALNWRQSGIKVLNEEINKQVYPDGIQFELSTTYHITCIDIFIHALKIVKLAGVENGFPEKYIDLVEKMVLAVPNFSFPDYTYPLFGDSFLSNKESMLNNYAHWAEVFPQDQIIKYFATDGKQGNLPNYLSHALPNGGFYSFRNGWDKKSTVMVLKASPPGEFHAQPDNGTFELWVKGRNFTPDAGSYTYNDSSKANNKRAYYGSTQAHQTLTLDNKNMVITKAVQQKWATSKDLDILTYTNPSYKDLNHQRTVLFIDQKYFVIIDRANGTATGNLGIHFTLKEDSKPIINKEKNTITTSYTDGNNLLIQLLNKDKVTLNEEKSFVSYQYQTESPRPAFVFEKAKTDDKTQSFISILYPFDGNKAPKINIEENAGNDFEKGNINLTLIIDGKKSNVETTLAM
jgi:hypothetical protein